ncbi:sulfite exporter TauE/SafE family protein [Lentzea sp. BCCO 10_0798]|uniref:Probable membrane transporter protein n=1 Tax=Lentzea kristufekii TaxID=3095430 RepID=A0ABU4TZV2_9PSEU|nr:sulfite exporter TauE/SafE family protein [Lentzea sp. BCCO 10_0798]MDX8053840.1 sulfite exporter TauE/SafE family protein [Lentzea sp. BCCO 10_0798]
MSGLLLALAAGAVVGLALGALGGGGGVLAVPALIYLLGLPPATAATASLLIVTATSLTALTRQFADVAWRTGLLFGLAGLPTAIVAGFAAHHIPAPALTAAFAVLATVAATVMLRDTRAPTHDPGHGSSEGRSERAVATATRTSATKALGAGAGLGAVTGLLGVGGGFLAVPALVTTLSLRMRTAVATSLLVIVLNSAVALATRLVTTPTSLDWAVVAPFAATAILGAWDGKRLAAKLSARTLQRVFAFVLLAVAAFMLIEAAIRTFR